MARSKSSRDWLKQHFNDPYVKQAQQLGYRSRAVFKLLEIQEKDKILKPGMIVVDLGAAPGGWSQIAAKIMKNQGRIVAMDILPMEPLSGVEFLQGDFSDDEVLNQLRLMLLGQPVDAVLCDISPNKSGIYDIDQPRSMYLAELALEFAQQVLKPQGVFLIKVFQGEGFESYLKQLRSFFKKVQIRKPKASRAKSNEVYLLARDFKDIINKFQ